MIPLTLLTGFLGSGKTTLLAHLLDASDTQDTAVVINEFGEVGIDHLIVANLAENIVELRNGCLCCVVREDLVLVLRDLIYRRNVGDIPRFNRVIVETSGLADPVPIMHTVMETPALAPAYTINSLVTVVDGLAGRDTLRAHQIATDQIALADIVVISKTDIAPQASLAALQREIRAINPQAALMHVQHGRIAPQEILARAGFNAGSRAGDIAHWLAHHAARHQHDLYLTHALQTGGTLSLAGTSVFLNRVVNRFDAQILRIKGIARFQEKSGQAGIVHAVQNKFFPIQWLDEWPPSADANRLVFIGRDLDADWIDEHFEALCIP